MGVSFKKKLVLVAANFTLCFQLLAEDNIIHKTIPVEKISTTQLTPLESLFPMILGLGGILLMIFLLAFLLKKMTGLNIVSNNIKVIESQSLGAKEKLVIVEIQHQQYVLGVTAHSINQICQLETNIEKKSSMMSFDKIMKQFLSPEKGPADKNQTEKSLSRIKFSAKKADPIEMSNEIKQ